MEGQYCRVERADAARHAAELFAAYAEAPDDRGWTYLPVERSPDLEHYRTWLETAAAKPDRFLHAIIDKPSGRASGVAAYLRIDAPNGVIEVGHINLAPRLQRTRAATEAMFLMMRRAFDELGYRRYEWKCDSLNEPSRKAALRYGFRFEGIFRQAVIYKGRNRDTAWFSIIDAEWPAIRSGFERWLDPANFDEHGRQRGPLSRFIAAGRHEALPNDDTDRGPGTHRPSHFR
jgi:RimJ/RimL family protein N-acetyltransferase